MFNKKQKPAPEFVPEFGTGMMLQRKTAVMKEALLETFIPTESGYGRHEFIKGSVYFRFGTVKGLDWSYVRVPGWGEPQYFLRRADLEVDVNGKEVKHKKIKMPQGIGMTGMCGPMVAPKKKRNRK